MDEKKVDVISELVKTMDWVYRHLIDIGHEEYASVVVQSVMKPLRERGVHYTSIMEALTNTQCHLEDVGSKNFASRIAQVRLIFAKYVKEKDSVTENDIKQLQR